MVIEEEEGGGEEEEGEEDEAKEEERESQHFNSIIMGYTIILATPTREKIRHS